MSVIPAIPGTSEALAEMPDAMSELTAETASVPPSRGASAVKHSVLNRILMLLINASTGILKARALGVDGNGQLAAMILWPGFLASATMLGLPSSLIFHIRRHIADGRRGSASLIFNGMLMVVFFGIIASAIAEFFLPGWMQQYSPNTIRWAQIFVLTLPLCSIMVAGQAILEALDQFSLSNVVQTLVPVATLLALLGCLFTHHLTPVTAGISYVASAIPTSIAILVLLWRQKKPQFHAGFNLQSCKLLLGYGIRSSGIDLLGALSIQIDQVLVVRFLAPGAMGAYVVMLSLSRMLGLFQSAVVMVLFPKAAGRSREEVVELVGRSVRVSMLVTALCACGVGILGPILIRLLYGRQYLGAIDTLRVLLIEITIQGGVFVMAQAFMAMGRPGIVTTLQAIGLSLSIPAMLILIPRYGVTGAAASLLISTVARFIFIYLGFRFFLKTPLPKIVPGAADAKLLLQLATKFR